MPLAVEIVLIVIGILLLAAALIGSGISRRLMTIPKMHRAPRIVLAVLGVLLLAGGAWGLMTGKEQHSLSVTYLRKLIPQEVKSALHCDVSTEAPKGAVEEECDSTDDSTTPEQVWYTMFPNVNAMQDYWFSKAGPDALTGTQCQTIDDFKTGSKQTYYLSDRAITIGDFSCTMSGNTAIAIYTDRRYNIVVFAQDSNPQHYSDFANWMSGPTSQPTGKPEPTPATPSHTTSLEP